MILIYKACILPSSSSPCVWLYTVWKMLALFEISQKNLRWTCWIFEPDRSLHNTFVLQNQYHTFTSSPSQHSIRPIGPALPFSIDPPFLFVYIPGEPERKAPKRFLTSSCTIYQVNPTSLKGWGKCMNRCTRGVLQLPSIRLSLCIRSGSLMRYKLIFDETCEWVEHLCDRIFATEDADAQMLQVNENIP